MPWTGLVTGEHDIGLEELGWDKGRDQVNCNGEAEGEDPEQRSCILLSFHRPSARARRKMLPGACR